MTLFYTSGQKPKEGLDQPPMIAAFAADPETGRLLDRAFALGGYENAEIVVARLSKVIQRYRILTPPPSLIVDISGSIDPLPELGELAALCPPDIQVFVLGTMDSIDLYRRLTAIGVADYLVKPVSPEQVLDTLSRESQGTAVSSQPKRRGKILSVVGIRGGVGSTTLALNIGWGLSQNFRRQSALLDLDLTRGSLALDLGVEPASGFLDLLADPSRLDSSLLAQSSVVVAERLTLLAPKTLPLKVRGKAEAQVSADLARQLTHHVSFTILDLTNKPVAEISPVLEVSDIRVLVMDRRVACLRDTALLLEHMPARPGTRTIVVLNNPRPAGLSDFTREQIGEVIGTDIETEIPYERRLLDHAATPQRPLITRHGAAARALQRLNSGLAGIPPGRSRFPWLSSLRRRGHVR